jgi:hypothetical protein
MILAIFLEVYFEPYKMDVESLFLQSTSVFKFLPLCHGYLYLFETRLHYFFECPSVQMAWNFAFLVL